MSYISKNKKRLNLNGIFGESMPTAKRKPRIYTLTNYILPVKATLSIDGLKLDSIVVKPSKPGRPAKQAKPKQAKIKPVRGPVLKARLMLPPTPTVEKLGREARAYKPSPEEIERAADIIVKLRNHRLREKE